MPRLRKQIEQRTAFSRSVREMTPIGFPWHVVIRQSRDKARQRAQKSSSHGARTNTQVSYFLVDNPEPPVVPLDYYPHHLFHCRFECARTPHNLHTHPRKNPKTHRSQICTQPRQIFYMLYSKNERVEGTSRYHWVFRSLAMQFSGIPARLWLEQRRRRPKQQKQLALSAQDPLFISL